MKAIQLGRSGLRVSGVCLGTMTFAREADETASFAIADEFVERGGFFVDTANVYNDGASEETVGRWMKTRGNRADIVLATKVFGQMGTGPNDGGLSRVHIIKEVEQSLTRLKTDVIDLYQIHRWSAEAPVEESARALDDLIRSGKIRYIRASNLKASELLYYLRVADDALMSRFISLQPVYNALNRGIELEILPVCEQEGIGVIAYNPQAGGLLTGKYKQGNQTPLRSTAGSPSVLPRQIFHGAGHGCCGKIRRACSGSLFIPCPIGDGMGPVESWYHRTDRSPVQEALSSWIRLDHSTAIFRSTNGRRYRQSLRDVGSERIRFTIGDSIMNPETRLLVNDTGFCLHKCLHGRSKLHLERLAGCLSLGILVLKSARM